MPRLKNDAVGPIRIVRRQSAARRTADQGTQRRHSRHIGKPLRVTEGGCALRPAIETQNGFGPLPCEVQQRFVQGHVEVRPAWAGIQ